MIAINERLLEIECLLSLGLLKQRQLAIEGVEHIPPALLTLVNALCRLKRLKALRGEVKGLKVGL